MQNRSGKVLMIDDDEDVLFAARLCLRPHLALLQTETDPDQLPHILTQQQFDLILLDMNFKRDVSSGQEGLDWLAKILQLDPAVKVIMITAYADVALAVKAIKEGAVDFIVKPWQNEKILETVLSFLKPNQTHQAPQEGQPDVEFIGNSPAFLQVLDTIAKVADTDANVLIWGENGTGKELAARALYGHSRRKNQAFVKVDMGALSGQLFESELFGHVKGAFTDAHEDRPGRFEVGDGGTLFLDEIGNLPLDLQAKLLTVLQSRQVTRVGSHESRNVDIRLICATNQSLPDMVAEGTFRQDLFYRINTVGIELPPLRDRREDIVPLVQHFFKIYTSKYRRHLERIHASTWQKLNRYDWPGNVRELQHAVERAVIMSSGAVLQPDDFEFHAGETSSGSLPDDIYNLEEVEKVVIRKALARFDGNVSRVARELGLSRASLYRRLERYGL